MAVRGGTIDRSVNVLNFSRFDLTSRHRGYSIQMISISQLTWSARTKAWLLLRGHQGRAVRNHASNERRRD